MLNISNITGNYYQSSRFSYMIIQNVIAKKCDSKVVQILNKIQNDSILCN